MMPRIQACVTYLTPHPREVARTLKYHIDRLDGAGSTGATMLEQLDKLPSAETFDDLLSCDIPRVQRSAAVVSRDYMLMYSPSQGFCRYTLMVLDSDIVNAVEGQAMLEMRDRLIGRVNTMPALHARLADRIAAADRSLRAIGTPGPGLYANLKNTAFMLVALKQVANNPLHGPRLLGSTPPRRAFVADFVRLFVVLISVVGAAALVVRSGIALGAMVGTAFGSARQTALSR